MPKRLFLTLFFVVLSFITTIPVSCAHDKFGFLDLGGGYFLKTNGLMGHDSTVFFWVLSENLSLLPPKAPSGAKVGSMAMRFKADCKSYSLPALREVAIFSPSQKLIDRNKNRRFLSQEFEKVLLKPSAKDFWSEVKALACAHYDETELYFPYFTDDHADLLFTFGLPAEKGNNIISVPISVEYQDSTKVFRNNQNKKIFGIVKFETNVDCKKRKVYPTAPFELEDIAADRRYLLSSAEENFISNTLSKKNNAERVANLNCDHFTFVIGTRK